MLENFTGYEKKNWKNSPDKTTPLSAENLDHMDSGIKMNADAVIELREQAKEQKKKTDAALSAVNTKIASITPDDTAVDGKPWTSKHIVDMLCPPLKVSGNPVQCYPVAGYPLGITASWVPTQEGTGDPSPENIRPIKGRDSVAVTRCGQNLYCGGSLKNIAWANDYRDMVEFLNSLPIGTYILMLTFRLDKFNSRYTSDTEEASALQVVIKRKGDYTIANNKAEMVTTKTVLPLEKNIALELNITSDDIGKFEHVYCYACGRHTAAEGAPNGALGWGTIYNVSITIGSVVSEYTPYTGNTTTLTLPETIYGGSVDAVNGNGEEEWKFLTCDGDALKFTQVGEFWNATSRSAPGIGNWDNQPSYIKCSHFLNKFKGNEKGGYIWTKQKMLDIFNTCDELNAYLAAQYAAGTPVQFAYKLRSPASFSATGNAPIKALSGINTVLTDVDSVEVTGREDLPHAIAGQ